MITFKQFFKESTSQIPALDGKREVYIFEIDETLNIQPFVRTSSRMMLGYFDTAHPRCIVDYNNALNFILKDTRIKLQFYIYLSEYEKAIKLFKVKEIFNVLKDVHGTWKIWDYSGNLPENTDNITVGFEVDLDYYKGINYAADDLLGF